MHVCMHAWCAYACVYPDHNTPCAYAHMHAYACACVRPDHTTPCAYARMHACVCTHASIHMRTQVRIRVRRGRNRAQHRSRQPAQLAGSSSWRRPRMACPSWRTETAVRESCARTGALQSWQTCAAANQTQVPLIHDAVELNGGVRRT